jgi:hypothetical protein
LPIFFYLAWRPVANYEFIVYLTMGLCLLMVLTSFSIPHTPPGSAKTQGDGPKLSYFQALKRLVHNRGYLIVLASYFLVSASFCIQSYYSPPRLCDLGLNRAWIGPAQCIGVVAELICFYYRKPILQFTGYAGSVLIGSGVLLLRQFMFALMGSLPWLLASYVLVGMTVVFYYIGITIVIDHLAAKEVKATAQSLMLLCSSGVGPLFANWTVNRIVGGVGGGLTHVFWFAAALAGGALLVLWLGRHQIVPHEKTAAGH